MNLMLRVPGPDIHSLLEEPTTEDKSLIQLEDVIEVHDVPEWDPSETIAMRWSSVGYPVIQHMLRQLDISEEIFGEIGIENGLF